MAAGCSIIFSILNIKYFLKQCTWLKKEASQLLFFSSWEEVLGLHLWMVAKLHVQLHWTSEFKSQLLHTNDQWLQSPATPDQGIWHSFLDFEGTCTNSYSHHHSLHTLKITRIFKETEPLMLLFLSWILDIFPTIFFMNSQEIFIEKVWIIVNCL